MTEQEQPMNDPATATHTRSDGLWRWLFGGLAAGGIILGLLIAAYAIGYHRGQHHPRAATSSTPTAPTTTATATTTTAATTPSPTVGPVAVTPALVARGKNLYTADGCAACHSLTGSAGVGPSFKGLASSTVTLTNGQTLPADDAYLEHSLSDPDAQIVKGYRAGVMPAAIAGYNLTGKPNDIRALVAYIKSTK
jgi:mono/diheme cytochrome c family protein